MEKFKISLTKSLLESLGNSQLKTSKKHIEMNMGDILLSYLMEISKVGIESQVWKGLDGNIKNTKLKELLYRSNFQIERRRASDILTSQGVVLCILVNIDNEWVIRFFEIYNGQEEIKNIIWVEGKSGIVKNYKNIDYDVYYKWYKGAPGEVIINEKNEEIDISGKIVRKSIIYAFNDQELNKVQLKKMKNKRGSIEVLDSVYIFDSTFDVIPGIIIENNDEQNPDWIRVASMLYEMNQLGNDIPAEWENTKTIWNKIRVFGNGDSPEKTQTDILSGKNMLPLDNINSKLANPINLMMSGSSSLQNLIATLAYLEDRAYKFSFNARDMDNSGTNKHNNQISFFSQYNSEYLKSKITQRELDYTRFFKLIARLLKFAAPKIKIEGSIFEQGKEDGMKLSKEQAKLYSSQAKAQSANAKKQLVDAEMTKKEVKQNNTKSKKEIEEDDK